MHTPIVICKMRKLQIQVLTRDGRKTIYETDRSRNVADLKMRIGRAMNVPMAFSRLCYKGRLLTNNSILEDEGVKRMSTLELYWQPLVLTAKQYREKELELDTLDQKQRHVSRSAENYEQTVLKGNHERTSSGLPRTRDHMMVKRSLSADDLKPLSSELPSQQQGKERAHGEDEDMEQEELELSSASSDEMDFLAAYWCCPKSSAKKTRNNGSEADIQPYLATSMDDKKFEPNCELLQSATSNTDYSCNMLKTDKFLDDMLEPPCGIRKHQPFRTGVRLAAGRMSRSIITNIRKNKKNCKK